MNIETLYEKAIEDGIYDISGIEILEIGEDLILSSAKINRFCKKYPNFATTPANDVDYGFLLSETPTKEVSYLGGSYLAGLTVIIDKILIYARND